MSGSVSEPLSKSWAEDTVKADASGVPRPALRFVDAVAITVGIVVGAGIFRTPSLVAANAASEATVMLAWAVGGVVSLVGALCYAELATTYPHAGGDYHYLTRAFGHRLSFLFAWARVSVIQTGSIALLAFVFGDYAGQILPLGGYSSSLYAALAVIALTGLNITGVRQGTLTQNVLTAVEVLGVMLIIVAAFVIAPTPDPLVTNAPDAASSTASTASFGLVMVFVLLTYGGWNEAVYVSAELRGGRRNMALALIVSILIITALYMLVNFAYLHALGLEGTARSETIGADVMRRAVGEPGALIISALIAVSALTSANATVITGARTNYALGRDFPSFAFLGRWNERQGTPVNALIVQGAVALLLVGLGTLTRKGFGTIVEYTAPVFWFFFLLTGISLFVLRRKEPQRERPFRVPLYPLTPLVFCLTSAYLLYSSLAYTGVGALVGVAVLAAGALLLVAINPRQLQPNFDHPKGR
ncbi:MAG TPA: amino acid permease [Pyrinomonadaceae bacterium]|nr:amino acid permease [Pyrinomonadaceae bacterium]